MAHSKELMKSIANNYKMEKSKLNDERVVIMFVYYFQVSLSICRSPKISPLIG